MPGMVHPENLKPGFALGRYEIVRRLGRGGMGSVYEAEHVDLRKRVAIKTLKAEYTQNPQILARFLREGVAASRIRHPHVVDVSDVGNEGELAWLVMELLEGEDLGTLLDRERSLSPERTADLLVPVISAIMAVHEAGIIHRDLKPANIFLAKTRHGGVVPKVLDFGISKMTGGVEDGGSSPFSLTATEALLGTPYFMSPEQVLGARNATRQSDQYALGVVLYRCVTGRLPFKTPELYPTLRAIESGQFRPPRELVPEISERFDAMIRKAMHRDPAERFESVHALGAELLQHASPLIKAQWGHVFGEAAASLDVPPPAAPQERISGVPLNASPWRAPTPAPLGTGTSPIVGGAVVPSSDGTAGDLAPSITTRRSPVTIESIAPATPTIPMGSTTLGGSARELSPVRLETLPGPPRRARRELMVAGIAGVAVLLAVVALVGVKLGSSARVAVPPPAVIASTPRVEEPVSPAPPEPVAAPVTQVVVPTPTETAPEAPEAPARPSRGARSRNGTSRTSTATRAPTRTPRGTRVPLERTRSGSVIIR
jgi:serine/threonine-protein kinase